MKKILSTLLILGFMSCTTFTPDVETAQPIETFHITGHIWIQMSGEQKIIYLEGVGDGASMLVQIFINAQVLGPQGLAMNLWGISLAELIEYIDEVYSYKENRDIPVIILIYWNEMTDGE